MIWGILFRDDIIRKITALAIRTFASASVFLLANATTSPQEAISGDISEQIILRLLHQSTTDAINDYYGEHKQYWRQNILSVQKLPQSPYYEVIIQAETFCSAHNPPYGIETMVFHVGILGEVQLVHFDHQDER